jgi:hypothetical protein
VSRRTPAERRAHDRERFLDMSADEHLADAAQLWANAREMARDHEHGANPREVALLLQALVHVGAAIAQRVRP